MASLCPRSRCPASVRLVAAGVVAAFGLAAPSHAAAQDDDHDDDHHHGLHFSHPLFAESVSPDTKLRFDLGRSWEGDANASEVEVEAEYAFHRSFSIEVVLPYAVVQPEDGPSVNNVGSAEIALKFANFAFEEQGVLLGYGVEAAVPTGSDEVGIGSAHIWELEPFLNIGWQRGAFEALGFAIFGIPFNQADGEELETEFKYNASALYRVTPRFQALLEFQGQTVLSGEEAGERFTTFSPGIKVAPMASQPLFLGLGVLVPIEHEELDASLKVSAFYHF